MPQGLFPPVCSWKSNLNRSLRRFDCGGDGNRKVIQPNLSGPLAGVFLLLVIVKQHSTRHAWQSDQQSQTIGREQNLTLGKSRRNEPSHGPDCKFPTSTVKKPELLCSGCWIQPVPNGLQRGLASIAVQPHLTGNGHTSFLEIARHLQDAVLYPNWNC